MEPIKRNMATARQIDANRENAQRSTGPKTAAGKEQVRYNAMKHGLLSEAALLPDEDEASFHDLSAKIAADLRPVGEMESALVDRIVNILWRLRRFSHVETGLFVREDIAEMDARLDEAWQAATAPNLESRQKQSPGSQSESTAQVRETLMRVRVSQLQAVSEAQDATPRHRLGDAFAHDASTGNAFSKLARYETQLNRTLERTLSQLQELQQRRAAKTATR
jgi:hypothetical protein